MADYTLTLNAEEESALSALIEQWTREQPETAWTASLVLHALVRSELQSTLRALDRHLDTVAHIARSLTRAQYLPMINALSGAQRERLRQLLGES